MDTEISTENKIKEAARKLFQQKGFDGTRSRDIADEAGINLALLNYYFRSKEKLYELIMEESIQKLIFVVSEIIYDKKTSLSEKINLITGKYIDLTLENPHLPLFVLSAIQSNPERFMKRTGIDSYMFEGSECHNQLKEQLEKADLHSEISPIQIVINIASMCIFPLIAKPMTSLALGINNDEYHVIINERRKLVPLWIKQMLYMQE